MLETPPIDAVTSSTSPTAVLHQLDQKIIYPHYDFKHLTEKYFEIRMKLNDFSIQLVKYCTRASKAMVEIAGVDGI